MHLRSESLWDTFRTIARAVRQVPDRVLHPLRRWQARGRLRRNPFPATVLFVCRGNICRSPYAAEAFRRELPSRVQARVNVVSGGFLGPDRPPPPEAITEAASRGVRLDEHRSQLLTRQNVEAADLIVVMDAAQRRLLRRSFGRAPRRVLLLGDLDPGRIDTRTIRDPVLQSPEVFRNSYARIDRCIRELVGALGTQAQPPGSAAAQAPHASSRLAPEQPS